MPGTTDDPTRTTTESAIAEIWAETLQNPDVGIDDDFVGLGGDSLQATRVVGRVGRRFGLNLRMSVLFEARTVRELARRVDRAQRPGPGPAA